MYDPLDPDYVVRDVYERLEGLGDYKRSRWEQDLKWSDERGGVLFGWVAQCDRCSAWAKLTWATLNSCTRNQERSHVWPSLDSIALALGGRSRANVLRWLNELARCEHIDIIPESYTKTRAIFILHDEPPDPTRKRITRADHQPPSPWRISVKRKGKSSRPSAT